VQCGEGEEARLKRLATYLDRKAGELARGNASLGEARLLLLTGLTVADELFEAYEELQRLRSEAEEHNKERDAATTRAVDAVASRLERLAAALEKT
jgi:cell division protein ZapA